MQHIISITLKSVICLGLLIGLISGTSIAEQSQKEPQTEYRKIDTGVVDWERIEVLDLRTAEHIALAGNPSIGAAEARVKQAEERVSQARSAYWPRLDANAGASRLWLSENDYQNSLMNPFASTDDPTDYYQTDLTASWLVFNGFARSLINTSAQYGRDQLEYSREDVKRILLRSVATAYLSAQFALENSAITRSDEAFYRDRYEEAKVRRQIGTGSLSDELNFEVRVNAAISDRIKAERVYEAALYSLAALLGLDEARLPEHVTLAALHTETEEEMRHPDPSELISYAYDHRPDVIQQDIAVQNSAVEVKIARSNFYPTINVTGSISGDRDEDYYFEGDDFGNSVGVLLTYNIFAGGLDRAKTREARQREIESKKNLEKSKLGVAADIRASIANLRASQDQLLLLRSNQDLIRQNRDLAEMEYNAGQGSLVRLNEAQRDLTAAKNRLALALVSMRQSWYVLETETGHILVYFQQ